MKFFVESHTILKNRSGVGWFTHGLVKGMQSQLQPGDSLHLITHPKEPMDVSDLLAHPQTFDRPIDWLPPQLYHRFKHRNTMPPLDLGFGNDGVYIFPNFIRWPLLRAPAVTVVHDLSMFLYHEYSSPANLRFMTRHLPRSIARSNLIVAVSNSTKSLLCEHFDVNPDKVVVSLEAAEPELYYPRSDDEVRQAKAKYGIFGKYLFFVSTLEPRKNVEGLVRAYRALPKQLRQDLSLVLVGGRGWKDDAIRAAIHQGRLADDKIILPGYVETEDLPSLYSGAEAFVFPSHYEGFGLPVLEAMSCGTPVLTADNSSLPEVGGDAPIYINSASHDELVEGIKTIVNDSRRRRQMIEKGLAQARKFSWQQSARTVMDGIRTHL